MPPEGTPRRPAAAGRPSGPDDTPARPVTSPDETPALPVRSPDDSDIGWGELPDRDRDDHLREDRPPHWDE
jgi:hypothetical protein